MNKQTKLKVAPKFASESQERVFWETHDSTQYMDWSNAQKTTVPNVKPKAVAKINSKGQVTIPARIREVLRLSAGDRVEFVEVEPDRYLLVAATRPVTDLKGMFGKPAKVISIDDMKATIAIRGASGG